MASTLAYRDSVSCKMKHRAQAINPYPAKYCFSQVQKTGNQLSHCGLLNVGYLIALLGDSLLQNIIGNIFAQGYNSSSGLVADLGGGYAVQSLQCLFGVHLAVFAHHAFNFQCLFHGFRLLFGC